MIDNIRIIIPVKEKNIDVSNWNVVVDDNCLQLYYYIFIRRIRIAYYPSSENLLIGGKITGIDNYGNVRNLDDIFCLRIELEKFFEDFNSKINKYIKGKKIDILTNKSTRIDFCFNIKTDYVKEYIKFFNLFYTYNKDNRFLNYSNFNEIKDIEPNSSFYLKTAGQMQYNQNQNFTINFYDKENQLIYRRKKQLEKQNKSFIKSEEIEESKGILRLEVQSHYVYLKSICKKFDIDFKNRKLIDFVDIKIAEYAVCNKIEQFFTKYDFYSYNYVKQLLNTMKVTKDFKEYVLAKSKNNKVSSRYFDQKLMRLGICPYMFIPSKWGIEKLDNPIKLIKRKISDNNLYGLALTAGDKNELQNSA